MDCAPTDIMQLASSPWLIERENGRTLMAAMRAMLTNPATARWPGGLDGQPERPFGLVGDVAVIRIVGVLGGYWGLSYARIQEMVRAADVDPAVKWILLDIASPGGLVQGCQETAAVIAGARKRVVAYASGYCCSAAYWLASAADEIVAAETAQLGCLGTAITYMRYMEEFEKTFVSSQTPHKRADLDDPEDQARIQVRLDALARVFLGEVAINRGFADGDAAAEAYGRGDTFVAADALKLGLCDRLHLGLPLDAPYPPSSAADAEDGEEAMDIKDLQAQLEKLTAQQKTAMEHATALEARVKSAEDENKALTAQLAQATQEAAAAKKVAEEAQAKANQAGDEAAKQLAAAQVAQDVADFELGVTQGRWTPAAKDQFVQAAAEKRAGRPGWFDSQFGANAAPPGAAPVAASQKRLSHGERPGAQTNAAGLRSGNDPDVIALAEKNKISRAQAARILNNQDTARG